MAPCEFFSALLGRSGLPIDRRALLFGIARLLLAQFLAEEFLRLVRVGEFLDRETGESGLDVLRPDALDLAGEAVDFAGAVDDDIDAAVTACQEIAACLQRGDQLLPLLLVRQASVMAATRSALVIPLRSCCCCSKRLSRFCLSL